MKTTLPKAKTKPLTTLRSNESSGELLKRIFASLFAALVVVLVTTGCMKLDTKLTLSSNDTLSGAITVAFANSALAKFDHSLVQSVLPKTDHLFKGPGVTESNYADLSFTGKSYLFTSVPISKLTSSGNSLIYLTFKRDGDNINVTGSLDTSSLKSAGSLVNLNDAQLAELFGQSTIRIEITLPGTISYTNGKQKGNTVLWTGQLGDKISIGAVATSKPDVVNWPLIGGIVTVVLALGAAFALYFVLKKRKPLYGVGTN